MRNAFVLQHHHGDSGNAPEGSILRNLSNTRFDALAKRGLIREATKEEMEAGYRPPFEPEAFEDGEHEGGEKQAPELENKAAPEHDAKPTPGRRTKVQA